MKRVKVFLNWLWLFILLAGCNLEKQNKPENLDSIKQEIERFMSDYADLLRKRQLSKIPDLYHEDGAIFTVNGFSFFSPLDSIRALYLEQPSDPLNFRWENIRIDPLSMDNVLVTSKFFWNFENSLDTLLMAYSGVLVRTDKGWKIKHEHESGSLTPKPIEGEKK